MPACCGLTAAIRSRLAIVGIELQRSDEIACAIGRQRIGQRRFFAIGQTNLVRIDVSRADELEKAFRAANGCDGLLVQWDFLFAVMRKLTE